MEVLLGWIRVPEGGCHREIAVSVFEPNICLAVPVRVVSVAAGLGRGHSRIVSPADPPGEPLGQRVATAYPSGRRPGGRLEVCPTLF